MQLSGSGDKYFFSASGVDFKGYSTKGKQIQIDTADRFSRETLEKRLEQTPSNARCFAQPQGSSLMC
jgi:hypothetical protein